MRRRYVRLVEVRPATEADLDAMVEIMFAEPGSEALAFLPSIDGARRFSRDLWRRAGIAQFVVAAAGGDVAGFAWCSDSDVSLLDGAKAAVTGWGIAGPLRLVVRGWPRRRVDLPMPDGPKLIELQVHPSRRGGGIGAQLLEHVIAAVDGQPLSLTTRSDNPARHLYERHGFAVTATKDHPAFERRTGATGRILMVRP